jgi:hypothetical protein
MMATKVSRQAHWLPLTAPSGPAWKSSVSQEALMLESWKQLTVRIVTARIMLASMMKIAPPNSSINVSLRRSVAVTPHNSFLMLVKMRFVDGTSKAIVPVTGSTANTNQ